MPKYKILDKSKYSETKVKNGAIDVLGTQYNTTKKNTRPLVPCGTGVLYKLAPQGTRLLMI